MNYGTLKGLVRQYLECDEETFVNNIATFVRLMEEHTYRRVQLPDLRKNVTSQFHAGSPYLQIPSDYLSAYTMAATVDGEYRQMQNREVSFIKEAFPNAGQTGVPRFFGHFDDDTFIIAPTPDEEYEVELHYFFRPPSLSGGPDSRTTWLSEFAENVVLFGTILHGYTYLKGDQDVIAQYQKKFEDSLTDLQMIVEGRQRKDSFRKPDMRLPV